MNGTSPSSPLLTSAHLTSPFSPPTQCGQVPIPTEHRKQTWIYDGTGAIVQTLPGGSGIADKDVRLVHKNVPLPHPFSTHTRTHALQLVIYVSMDDACGPSTLAWATSCGQDQYGRPIAGTINFCPHAINGSKPDGEEWPGTIATTIHELAHVLILSSSLFGSFVDENRMFCSPPLFFSRRARASKNIQFVFFSRCVHKNLDPSMKQTCGLVMSRILTEGIG